MHGLQRTPVLLAVATGLLCGTTGAAFALAQGPGYKAGPLIGTIYPKAPRMVRPIPKPVPPPSHMGGTPWHPGGAPGGHGSAWHTGGMGGTWGAPRPGHPAPHGGSWHVGMGGYAHGWGRPGWTTGPGRPGNGWSHGPSWGGDHGGTHVGWGARPPSGVHPLGLHFYGMGGGSLAHAYGTGGGRFARAEVWRSTYRFGASSDLAARYGRLEHGFSPLLPPSNWGHGPRKPQPPHYAWQPHSGWSRQNQHTPGPVARHPPPPSWPAATSSGWQSRHPEGHAGWHGRDAWTAAGGWHPHLGWTGYDARHASHERHGRHHGVFAWLRRDFAREGGRVSVTWARFVYRSGGKDGGHHGSHTAAGHASAGRRNAWSPSGSASAGYRAHTGASTHYAAW